MARQVTIASGKSNVQLPNGGVYDAGDVVVLTDAQYAAITQSLIPGTIIDNGIVSGVEDAVITQAANVAALGALTSAAPAALTSSAPAAVTSSAPAAVTAVAITGGESPTEAEHNAVVVDVTALRATLLATQADVVALRATLAAVRTDLNTDRTERTAVQVDVASLRTKLNAALAALTGTGKAVAAP